MTKENNLAGKRFGRLVALEPTDRRSSSNVMWRCRCDCGREVDVSRSNLLQGNTRSCGCLKKEHESPINYMRYIDGTCVDMLERKKLRKDNTSGYTGVIFYRGKWRAQITFKRKVYNLGTYKKIEDAVSARKAAEERIFGEFLEWYYENYPPKKHPES